MTHDELLAKIQSDYEDNKHFRDERNWKQFTALRAVVELLKNYNDGQVRVNEEFNQGILAFSIVIKEAIEKELS